MRRIVLVAALTIAGAAGVIGRQATANALPLENRGLEHLDIIVPDPAASARFYMRLFRTALHQQPVRDTLRYFLLLGDLPPDRQVGYVAIGAAGGRPPAIGHYCVLTTVYDRAAMAQALQAAGYGVAGSGPTGVWPDPDGLELQLFQPPAGLVTAAVPSPLPVERDGFLVPRGVDHVVLRVRSLDKSLPYYRLVYGPAPPPPATRTGVSGFTWTAERVSGSKRHRARRPESRITPSPSRPSIAVRWRIDFGNLVLRWCPLPTSRGSSASPTTTVFLSR